MLDRLLPKIRHSSAIPITRRIIHLHAHKGVRLPAIDADQLGKSQPKMMELGD
jgi:hypothetical protein